VPSAYISTRTGSRSTICAPTSTGCGSRSPAADVCTGDPNEQADELYSTDVLARLFSKESQGLYDVRTAVIGHVQQGGNPTPFDRVLATRLVDRAIRELTEQLDGGPADWCSVGFAGGELSIAPIAEVGALLDRSVGRPREQWWLSLRAAMTMVAEPPRG